MTFPERVLAMALDLGYKPPGHITEHAFDRWIERWGPGVDTATDVRVARAAFRVQVKAAVIESIAHKEAATIWLLGCGAKIVVAWNGNVMTVLPPGATRADRRPKKRARRGRRRR